MELENYCQTFDGLDFTEKQFRNHAFEQCVFLNSNFARSSFANALFENCTFENCNMVNVNLVNCKWQDVRFKHSKISGLDLELMSKMLLAFSFENCAVSYCNFKDLKVPKTAFLLSEIKECDFAMCNLSGSNFSGSDLIGSNFIQCDLTKTNFSTAVNYRFDLNKNKVKAAKFSNPEVLNFLEPYGVVIE